MHQIVQSHELRRLRAKLHMLPLNHRNMLKRHSFTMFKAAGTTGQELPEFLPIEELELISLTFYTGQLPSEIAQDLPPVTLGMLQPFSALLTVRRFVRDRITGQIVSDPSQVPDTVTAVYELNTALSGRTQPFDNETSPYATEAYALLTTALRDFLGEGHAYGLPATPPIPNFLLTFEGEPEPEPTAALTREAHRLYPHMAAAAGRALALQGSVVPIIDGFPTYPSHFFAELNRRKPGQEPGAVIADLRAFRGRRSPAAWQTLVDQRLITGDQATRQNLRSSNLLWRHYLDKANLPELLQFQAGANLLTRNLIDRYRIQVGDFDRTLTAQSILDRFLAADQSLLVHPDWAAVQVLATGVANPETLQFHAPGVDLNLFHLTPDKAFLLPRVRTRKRAAHDRTLARSA